MLLAHDADRILHCHAYARYMDKTQVFFQIARANFQRNTLDFAA